MNRENRTEARLQSAEELVVPNETPASRATLRAMIVLLYYQGFVISINGFASPWIAKSFGLDQAGIARLFAWIGLSALGTFWLSRMADRLGRRRLLVSGLGAVPICAMGAALSTNVASFIVFEVVLYAFLNATIAGCIVMFAEQMPTDRRAEGQSYGGLASAMGGGVCALMMPALVAHGLSWRWLLWIATGGIVLLPTLARAIPESARWQSSASLGMQDRARFYDVFQPVYRKRTLTLITTSLMSTVAVVAILTWGYFHMVTVAKLSPASASAITIVAGGVALVGFPAGARSAEYFGRVPTVTALGPLIAAGAVFFYWGPPAHFAVPALWLGIGYCWMLATANASGVASNAAVTELFPTALRATIMGWFAITGTVASITAQAAISVLAPRMGGLSMVVGALSILLVPSAMLFGLMIDETRGLSLEDSSSEDSFRSAS